jgi:eukaryotic-like serine/threonine-protein kinase
MSASDAKKPPGIFISYRRSDNPDATGRIYDRLVSEFGKSRVFKDVDSIPLGQDFRGHLNNVVGDCAVVLAIIGPRWTDARNSAGNRRLEDSDDFVRIELEAALVRDIPVVPVLVGHAAMSGISDLPASLASMVFRQSIEVRPDPDFHNDATRLVSALKIIIDPNAPREELPGSPVLNAAQSIHRARARRLAWMTAIAAVAALAAIALAVPALRYLRQAPPPETRTEINTPAPDGLISWFALSPDGRQIVFVARSEGDTRLWLRALGTTTAQPLPGTEGATLPFWSPDNRSIGFFANNSLRRLDLGGGKPLTLVSTVDVGGGGAWHKDGFILFGQGRGKPFARVSASGGKVTEVAGTGAADADLRIPQFLPDGHRFVYASLEGADPGIYLGSLDGARPVKLTADRGPIAYLPSGWLLCWRASENLLLAHRLDADKAVLVGEPITIAEGMGVVSASQTGLVAYRSGLAESANQLEWRTRSGGELGTIGVPDESYLAPRVSPDGRRVLVSRGREGKPDVWLLEGERSSRVTFDAETPGYPVWSPDGMQIVFASLKSGISDLYMTAAHGGEEARLLLGSDQTKYASSWSADGRYLLYFSTGPNTAVDLWVLPMSGERKPWVFLRTPFIEVWGQFSPDGKWVAYQSNETGRDEVFVRPFTLPGAEGAQGASSGKWQVSTTGGISPAWSPDGKELYYINRDGEMMAVPMGASATALQPGTPVKLFKTRILGGGIDVQRGRQYDVTADGRFLINAVVGSDVVTPITLIQNWNPDAGK